MATKQKTTFQPVTLVHKSGRERVAYSPAGLVQAQYDGYVPKAAADEKAAVTLEQATTDAATQGTPAPTAVEKPAAKK
jgi:hypothetical protein